LGESQRLNWIVGGNSTVEQNDHCGSCIGSDRAQSVVHTSLVGVQVVAEIHVHTKIV